jgi:hypothetical protein
MFGNIGGLISTWSFMQSDGPNYPIGNGLNLATSSTILIVGTLTLWWMKKDNQRRERKVAAGEMANLTQEQIEALDWRHPTFRWTP